MEVGTMWIHQMKKTELNQETLQTYLKELHDSVEEPVDYLEAGWFVVENGGEMALVAGPNFRT